MPRGDHSTARNGETDPGIRPAPTLPKRKKPRPRRRKKRGLVTRTAGRTVQRCV